MVALPTPPPQVQSDWFSILENSCFAFAPITRILSTAEGRMAVTKTAEVTVITLTPDPQSPCPPFWQIMKHLCIKPKCGTVSPKLRRIQGTNQSVLGTVQIMVGLLSISLTLIPLMTYSSFMPPFWMGGLFILFGAMCIVSEKYPSPCVVILHVIVNLIGVAFAIKAVVLYTINMSLLFMWSCPNDYDGFSRSITEQKDQCLKGQTLTLRLLGGIHAVLILLSLLELTVVILSATFGIRALNNKEERQSESPDEPTCYKPLLEDFTSEPAD